MEILSVLNSAANLFTPAIDWIVFSIGFLVLAYIGVSRFIYFIAVGALLSLLGAPLIAWLLLAVVFAIFGITPIRKSLISKPLMNFIQAKGLLPKISETEKSALEAGTVWAEKEIFSGKPNWNKLRKESYPDLTDEEQAFIDGPVEELCTIVNDWDVTQNRALPEEAWELIRKEKFFGMIIPKKYGGLGFSALAHSEVIMKLSSRSNSLCITIMVPNSLGPAELLTHYGTDAQKEKYLPKLATAEEIPCFALTEPEAGSDAASIKSRGDIFKGEDGKLYIRLNWNKRWITLASIATTIGLAFQLYDPEHLMGDKDYLGITCALVPSDLAGIDHTKRHDPLDSVFYNCPTEGKDVVIPVTQVIGEEAGVGKGWGMLMESLAAGRGISLPAQSVGGSKLGLWVTSCHAAIRKQFGIPVGKFEGVAEPLAYNTATNYMLEANRKFICGALDEGKKPPVITAIAKYSFTEQARVGINNAMDILGGAAISEGPRNTLANGYKVMPIGITVEGANILTRTLIIFGQGLLRGHPFLKDQVDAIESNNVENFDKAFWSHQGQILNTTVRIIFIALTRGLFVSAPGGRMKRYYQKLTWSSAGFAFLSNIALALGGKLKMREQLAGRYADVLSWTFLAFGVLRRWEAEGKQKEHIPLVQWCMKNSLHNIDLAFDGILANLNIPVLGWFFKGPIRSIGNMNMMSAIPSDQLNVKIANFVQSNSPARDALFSNIFVPKNEEEQVNKLNRAFLAQKESEVLFAKVKKHFKSKGIKKRINLTTMKDALAENVITQTEFDSLSKAVDLIYDTIQVDCFTEEEYLNRSLKASTRNQKYLNREDILKRSRECNSFCSSKTESQAAV